MHPCATSRHAAAAINFTSAPARTSARERKRSQHRTPTDRLSRCATRRLHRAVPPRRRWRYLAARARADNPAVRRKAGPAVPRVSVSGRPTRARQEDRARTYRSVPRQSTPFLRFLSPMAGPEPSGQQAVAPPHFAACKDCGRRPRIRARRQADAPGAEVLSGWEQRSGGCPTRRSKRVRRARRWGGWHPEAPAPSRGALRRPYTRRDVRRDRGLRTRAAGRAIRATRSSAGLVHSERAVS